MNVQEIKAKYAVDVVDPVLFGMRKSRPERVLSIFTVTPYWPSGTKVSVRIGGKIKSFVASGAPEISASATVKAKTKEDAIKKWEEKARPTAGYKLQVK